MYIDSATSSLMFLLRPYWLALPLIFSTQSLCEMNLQWKVWGSLISQWLVYYCLKVIIIQLGKNSTTLRKFTGCLGLIYFKKNMVFQDYKLFIIKWTYVRLMNCSANCFAQTNDICRVTIQLFINTTNKKYAHSAIFIDYNH